MVYVFCSVLQWRSLATAADSGVHTHHVAPTVEPWQRLENSVVQVCEPAA
jgi:hypothetical protein